MVKNQSLIRLSASTVFLKSLYISKTQLVITKLPNKSIVKLKSLSSPLVSIKAPIGLTY